ncbi:putative ubiquitin conjugation factor E4 [Diplonema papillatum]|nr:putative ubiquitin conjugation factor E4 [Diplonema papillatum]
MQVSASALVFCCLASLLARADAQQPPKAEKQVGDWNKRFSASGPTQVSVICLVVALCVAVPLVAFKVHSRWCARRPPVDEGAANGEGARAGRVTKKKPKIVFPELPVNPYTARVGSAEVPDEFFCPISMEIMFDPVRCSDGCHVFERSYLVSALLASSTCPLSRAPMTVEDITTDDALRARIEGWVAENPRNQASDTSSERSSAPPSSTCGGTPRSHAVRDEHPNEPIYMEPAPLSDEFPVVVVHHPFAPSSPA